MKFWSNIVRISCSSIFNALTFVDMCVYAHLCVMKISSSVNSYELLALLHRVMHVSSVSFETITIITKIQTNVKCYRLKYTYTFGIFINTSHCIQYNKHRLNETTRKTASISTFQNNFE